MAGTSKGVRAQAVGLHVALQLENEALSEQVKRLVRAEGKLYEYQEQLDGQLREYRKLYELNCKLNAASDLQNMFLLGLDYLIYHLGYQRAIFFQQLTPGGEYRVAACDGYYQPEERLRVEQLTISPLDPVLAPIFFNQTHFVCTGGSGQCELFSLRSKMHMHEFMFYPLGSGEQPLALLIVGNGVDDSGFYRRIKAGEREQLGLGNLVALLSSSLVRKRDEEEVSRLNCELQRKIEQLVKTQDELVQKEKLAILGQLSGSVGHELRNPLGVMSNAVYLLKMLLSDADEMVEEYLDIIKQEVDTSLRIIGDLLDFARTKTPQVSRVSLPELLAESLSRCTIPDQIDLQNRLPEGLPSVQIDRLQIRQVLENLITNAVQAMPEGGSLNFSAKPVAGGVELSVADTGEGIAPEHMQKLFQPLFTTKAKGMGLGLVVCDNLVQANKGSLQVSSSRREGTTFRLTLPVLESGE